MCFNTVLKSIMLKNINKIISRIEHAITWNSKLKSKAAWQLKFSKHQWITNTSMILKFSMDTNGKTVRINSLKKYKKKTKKKASVKTKTRNDH